MTRLSHDCDAVGSGRRGDRVDDRSMHDDEDVGGGDTVAASDVSVVLHALRSAKYREIRWR